MFRDKGNPWSQAGITYALLWIVVIGARIGFAHDIAGWLGISAGIVIAALIILRKKGIALRARRQQARASQPAPGQRPDNA